MPTPTPAYSNLAARAQALDVSKKLESFDSYIEQTLKDAALDFPLYFKLKPVVKGFSPPSDLVAMYAFRKQEEADVLSSQQTL